MKNIQLGAIFGNLCQTTNIGDVCIEKRAVFFLQFTKSIFVILHTNVLHIGMEWNGLKFHLNIRYIFVVRIFVARGATERKGYQYI